MTQAAESISTPTNRNVFAVAWPLAIKATMLHGIWVMAVFRLEEFVKFPWFHLRIFIGR